MEIRPKNMNVVADREATERKTHCEEKGTAGKPLESKGSGNWDRQMDAGNAKAAIKNLIHMVEDLATGKVAKPLEDVRSGKTKLDAGDHGPAVSHVQEMLHIPATGTFNADTRAAVKNFQLMHGIHPASGLVGPTTLKALERHTPSLDEIRSGHGKLEPGDRGAAVEHVQKMFHMQVTGVMDAATTIAVQNFQKAHGLHPATGEVGELTMKMLEQSHGHGLFGATRDLRMSLMQTDALIHGGHFDAARIQKFLSDSAIVNHAMKYLGTPYRWNFKNPEKEGGVDCSGLVDHVYSHNHIKLDPKWASNSHVNPSSDPKAADDAFMRHVDAKDAKPGDVVIFGNQHIGIYVGDVTDKSGAKVPLYIGANHGDRSPNCTGRVDIMPITHVGGFTPRFYHPTAKALGD